MKALHHALLTLLLSSSSPTLSTAALMIGDQVCMTGFIMDTFCINRGTLLDNSDVTTLQNPELHSYHCLLDVGVCINSGYQVLGSKDPMSGLYCPGLRIDDTDAVLMAGRAHGTPLETDPNFFQCDTCTGPDNNPTAGYRATIIGTVKELGEGMGRTTGMPGTRSVLGTPILTNIQVLDSMVKCDESIMVTVEADENDMCLIRSVSDDAGDTNTMGDDGSSSSPPPMMEDTTTTTTATTMTTTTTTSSPPAEVTTTPATAVVENDKDCSIDFCETTLTDGYTLKYKINEADATITMEATYDGEAWLGIAFSEDERMGGSDGILGTPDDGTPQKYRLNQGFIEIMSPEEQTLTDASVAVNENGQTVMKFTKLLVEPNQIPIISGENKMLWASGGGSTAIGYHGTNRSPFPLNLNFDGSSAPPPVVEAPPPVEEAPSLKVGDEICTTGFIMDTFCINRGTLLDKSSVATLKNPELHSYHCLLDVSVCINSGYQVLGEKDPTTGEYCLGYRIDDTSKVLAAGRAHGTTKRLPGFFSCSTCSGPDNNPIAGYRATVKGTIKELGDGSQSVSGQPLLTNIQMLDASEECATPAPQTVCLGSPDGAAPAPGTPSAGEKAPSADCSSVFCTTTLTDGYTLSYKLNEADGTVSMEATYDGESWLGIAFSEDERMGGSDGILGTPDDGTPQKYTLNQGFIEIMPPEEQTLTDASVEIVDGKTVMKFTKPLVEPNQIPITAGEINMLWANGGDGVTNIGYHGQNRAPVKINLASGAAEAVSAPNMGAWLAHGICAFIAWGLLAPTAVNSAIYRSLFKGPLWFKLHQFFNASAYALTVVAFAIALAFVSKEGNPHWFSSHAKMGLSMFIIASVQVLWGAVRPHLPDSGDEKSTIRKVWEIKHRLTGTVLLACGFWQMSAGIKLFAIKYSGVGSVQEQGVTIAYWIWIAVEVALLLVGGVHFKLLKKPVEEDDGNDATNAAADTVEGKQKEDAV